MKKFIAFMLLLIIFLVLCTGCSNTGKVTTAKVRYFDGSMDTLDVDHYWVGGNVIQLFLKNGAEMTLGVNNVIVIKESEEQYNQ